MSNQTPSQILDLRQSQQLVMTPQLQQAIKLLQLNNLELSEYVEEELEKNPLLEKDTSPPEGSSDSDQDSAEPAAKETRDNIQDEFDESWTGNEAQQSTKPDQDHSTGMGAITGSGGSMGFDDAENSFENRMSAEKSLREHLVDQLMIACSDSRDRMIGGMLIDQLDESGYLRINPKDLAEKLTCSEERIEKLLKILKGFDPTGIFAGNLEECLALQLEEKGALDEPMQKLLQNLKLLGDHDYKKLCSICGVNETYLKDMVGEIRALNPKPAGLFDHLVVQTAVPDVFMRRLPKHVGGGWCVELNNETLPRVLVNQEYYTTVASSAVRKEDKTYLSNQLTAANWLVRALDQRAQTILKTASAIIEEQDAFFNYGIEFLKPLTLKDIAEEIEMHESTVSRVTTGKYIGTPRGIFELKFFFSTALISESGAAHSSESIKARIKTLIDEEDPKKILSDDKIVSMLKEEGIDLARRTVAKYREAMHIPSSVQRRKQKRNA
jgi:RNA polymerase sigma-54 factor